MALNIHHAIMNGSNYIAWEPYMETLMNIKGLWKYTKIMILDPTNDQENSIVDGKKDGTVGVIMTYISWDIHFHIIGIDHHHQIWNKLKSLFH
jgi:hypothetical protein